MALPFFISNLLPKRERSISNRSLLTVLASLTATQWLQIFCGWVAWTCDAIDFFSVSLSVTALQEQFGKSTNDITTSITLTLLFRPIGAVVFGILSDRYGRKWPLVINLMICCVLQIGTGFVNTFREFLGIRSLFGISMGGIWGLAAATALENLPVECRGLISGVVQEGYAAGYLFAAVINLYLVPSVSAGWRALFWTAAGISAFGAFIRIITPESEIFLRAQRVRREQGETAGPSKWRVFMHETKEMLSRHWLLCIYAVLLMTGFNFLSHGSQDLYPTYLQVTKGFSSRLATKATIIGNCGAIAGGALAGFLSQYLGRRLTIVVFILLIGAFIPLWILPNTFGSLSAGAFCIQVGVQGAWGVIPIFLSEISPPAFRGTFPGVAYQLGNMVSSASSQIEATGGDHLRTTVLENGVLKDVPDYAKVQGILIGVVAAYVVVMAIIGPENHGSHFEQAKTAIETGGGADEVEDESVLEGHRREDRGQWEKASPRGSVREDDGKEVV